MLTPDQHAALVSLRTHFVDARIVIIGATALRLQPRLPRNTADVDLVITVSASEFPGSLQSDSALDALDTRTPSTALVL